MNFFFKQHFATTYRRLTKKIMASVYRSTFLVHFTMLAPHDVHGIISPHIVAYFLELNHEL
jgi:hypothetical protein